MTILGMLGLVISLAGLFVSRYFAEDIPRIAGWSMVAFAVLTTTGIAGSLQRSQPAARAVWGIAHLAVFTFTILQTIYYAYSSIISGTLFFFGLNFDMDSATIIEIVIQYSPFVVILALLCVFAVSTILSPVYIAGIPAVRHRVKRERKRARR